MLGPSSHRPAPLPEWTAPNYGHNLGRLITIDLGHRTEMTHSAAAIGSSPPSTPVLAGHVPAAQPPPGEDEEDNAGDGEEEPEDAGGHEAQAE